MSRSYNPRETVGLVARRAILIPSWNGGSRFTLGEIGRG